MYDAAAGCGAPAVAGAGIRDRIIASRRCGSAQVAAGTTNSAVANAIGTANAIATNATDATAGTGAQAGFAIRAS
jgi:hypothetical protein